MRERSYFLSNKKISSLPPLFSYYLYSKQSQVGSLAGAAHLWNNSAGVLRWAQRGQKPLVEEKAKSSFDFDFQYEYKL